MTIIHAGSRDDTAYLIADDRVANIAHEYVGRIDKVHRVGPYFVATLGLAVVGDTLSSLSDCVAADATLDRLATAIIDAAQPRLRFLQEESETYPPDLQRRTVEAEGNLVVLDSRNLSLSYLRMGPLFPHPRQPNRCWKSLPRNLPLMFGAIVESERTDGYTVLPNELAPGFFNAPWDMAAIMLKPFKSALVGDLGAGVVISEGKIDYRRTPASSDENLRT